MSVAVFCQEEQHKDNSGLTFFLPRLCYEHVSCPGNPPGVFTGLASGCCVFQSPPPLSLYEVPDEAYFSLNFRDVGGMTEK